MSQIEWCRARIWHLSSLLSRCPIGMKGRISLQAALDDVLDELAELEQAQVTWLEMGGV